MSNDSGFADQVIHQQSPLIIGEDGPWFTRRTTVKFGIPSHFISDKVKLISENIYWLVQSRINLRTETNESILQQPDNDHHLNRKMDPVSIQDLEGCGLVSGNSPTDLRRGWNGFQRPIAWLCLPENWTVFCNQWLNWILIYSALSALFFNVDNVEQNPVYYNTAIMLYFYFIWYLTQRNWGIQRLRINQLD